MPILGQDGMNVSGISPRHSSLLIDDDVDFRLRRPIAGSNGKIILILDCPPPYDRADKIVRWSEISGA